MMGKLIPVGTDPKPGELPEPITEDVVLPSQGGKLDVAVLKDGAAAAGMFVSARMENINLPGRQSDEATRKIVDDIAQPLVKTDEAGIAHFENLLPGRYEIIGGARQRSRNARFLVAEIRDTVWTRRKCSSSSCRDDAIQHGGRIFAVHSPLPDAPSRWQTIRRFERFRLSRRRIGATDYGNELQPTIATREALVRLPRTVASGIKVSGTSRCLYEPQRALFC